MTDRLMRARELLEQLKVDGLLVWKLINVRYLCGFTGTEGVCLVTERDALFITDSRYTIQAQEQVTPNGFQVVTIKEKVKDIGARVRQMRLKRLAYEDMVIDVATHKQLQEVMEGTVLMEAGAAVEKLRVRKEAAEIALIREAIRIQEEAMEAVLPHIVPGAVERDIAFELEMEMRRRGASGVSFDTIVGSGPRGAMPHGVSSDKKIAPGELVVLDWGCFYRGYCSDQTLTVSVGPPSDPEAVKVFNIVRQAQRAAIEAIGPGNKMVHIDKAARDVIDAAGYGDLFGHGTGHCLGLEIHEEPRANTISTAVAETGMVFTVEPGIYLPDRFGVRLEDVMVVTPDGAECLTTMHKNWRSTI